MTAIAGCVGEPNGNYDSTCASMLEAQRIYGSFHNRSKSWGESTFGIALSEDSSGDLLNAQPLVGGDRFFLVADVRLDNRGDLLRDLNIARGDPHPQPDADILLNAWMHWGEACLDRLRGDYAFAVFDSRDRTLSLARDPTGQRPLFYARAKGLSAFASMPNALLGCGLFDGRFRLDRLASMLVGTPNASDITYFEGVQRVEPGGLVILSKDSALAKSYWIPPRDYLRLSPDDYVDAYHERLEAAVRPRLERSAGLLGAHLSSGYDSNAVAAEAARLSPDSRPLAFTAAPRPGFDGPVPRGRIADESSLAALAAERYAMPHVIVRPTGRALSNLRSHARLYQEPDRNIVNMEWWSAILTAARELGVSTMLTGQMGNLTIHAGGLSILSEWIRTSAWGRWWREANAAARRPDVHWRGVLLNSFEGILPPPILHTLSRVYIGTPTLTDQSFLREHWLRQIREKAGEQTRKGRTHYGDRLAILRLQDPGLFRKGALAEAGIDERDPTADRDLIDFSFALPPEQFLHAGVWRPLARRALAGRVPPAILDAPLRGYQGADWFERVNKAEARAVLEDIAPSGAVNELLDLGKIEQAIDQWPETGSASVRARTIYRNRLPIALATGVFLQEFESAGATSSTSRT